jgi:hypothetical protein
MPVTLTIPQVGLANATEEPKITTSLTALSAWANGNIADTDLRSPNSAVRRLMLTATAIIDDTIAAGDKIFTSDAYPVASGAACYNPPPMWAGDSGVSGQPPDFQVANKNAMARIRAALAVTAPPGITVTVGLYQVTGVAAVGRAISYTFAGAYTGSTVQTVSPAAGIVRLESGEFTLPMAAAVYALGVNLSASLPVNSPIGISGQLYAYNT